MRYSVRDKHLRNSRRIRSDKHGPNPSITSTVTDNTNGTVENFENEKTGIKPKNYHMALNALSNNPNPDSDSVFDDSGWGYCTEEQLEEILLKNLEFLYNEALNKLVGLGYDEEVALKAILRNGHCYGGMDVLTNVLHNSLAYLNSDRGNSEDPETLVFADLRQLEEYSLAGMVCLLQQIKPHWSKGDAMWCLLMSDLHMGRASVMEIPVIPSLSGRGEGSESVPPSGSVNPEGGVSNGGPVGVSPALCRFHGGWGFGSGGMSEYPINESNGLLSYAPEMALQREIEFPKRFNLSPSMKILLKRNVAMFAAGFRANSKHFYGQSPALSGGDSSAEVPIGHSEESQYAKNQDVVNSVMSKFSDLTLDGKSEQALVDQKDETLIGLVHQMKDLEKQVKERKEWAQQKAMQAARKLSNDLTEIKMLRMDRDETLLLKKGKQALDDATMKRLSDMENALRRASSQVDRANAAVRKLEIQNAEMKAEMEAYKLSASESVSACLEVAKREKKFLKRLLTWEKRKVKMQEDIAEEKQKISELKQELGEVETSTKESVEKCRQHQKAKELALAHVEEERRLKEASEANSKRKLESIRLKEEIDFQRHKDDLQRLEQEYQRLKESENPTETDHQNFNGVNTIAQLLDQLEDSSENEVRCDRECMICMNDEVCVLFLPCAHQVICANCNENYGKKGRALCPCCRAPIEQRIRVYGASS